MKSYLLMFVVLFSFGCNHVSQDVFQRELERSRTLVRQELRTEMGNGDVAALECAVGFNIYQQASLLCETLNAYCNVTHVYENYCLREGENDNWLPPRRGVSEALEQAVSDFNNALEQQTNTTNTTSVNEVVLQESSE